MKSDGVYYVRFLGGLLDGDTVVFDLPVGTGPKIVEWSLAGDSLSATGNDAQVKIDARAYGLFGTLPSTTANQELLVYQKHDDSAGADNPSVFTSGATGVISMAAHGNIGEYKSLIVLATKIKILIAGAGTHVFDAGYIKGLFVAHKVSNVVGMF